MFLASRLVWPVSALDKQYAAVRATQKTLTASVAGTEHNLPALEFSLASWIADYVASAAGARRPRREVLKGLLSINELSLAAARSILRRMYGREAEAREAPLAAAIDLWSAGLVLEREKRRIRHFCDHGSIKKGEGRWSLH